MINSAGAISVNSVPDVMTIAIVCIKPLPTLPTRDPRPSATVLPYVRSLSVVECKPFLLWGQKMNI